MKESCEALAQHEERERERDSGMHGHRMPRAATGVWDNKVRMVVVQSDDWIRGGSAHTQRGTKVIMKREGKSVLTAVLAWRHAKDGGKVLPCVSV